ncbi:2OG-Fe(II) oxygenase [Brevundimonas diminuta]|uniref:2OG-Fe(II) oxygenase n=1 Tax=Brevundimonas diminuta TaxID=293 RepID=UPI0022AFC6CC|nr:2OG-Fe(II) oxygenase [Brevundimonas diminuta]MCZ4108164.1 2OG-Fe(II) oxygenase [Brevundimonas diminuta]
MTDAALDWPRIAADLNAQGWALTGPLLMPATCEALQTLYDQPERFRSRIVMQRHGFGQGEYQYFAEPLPDPLPRLRARLYEGLAPIADDWARRMGRPGFPARLDELTASCRAAGQTRPTSLMLRYGPGDYNRLHQDLYGDLVFPLQAAILLSDPSEFEGGEFVLIEQKPRSQSQAHVVPLKQGQAVIFAVRERPVAGTRGDYRVQMRHGVSTVRAGKRMTLGLIFHDAV